MFEYTIDAPNQTFSGSTSYQVNHGISDPSLLIVNFDNFSAPATTNQNFTYVNHTDKFAWIFGPTFSGTTEVTIMGNLPGASGTTIKIS